MVNLRSADYYFPPAAPQPPRVAELPAPALLDRRYGVSALESVLAQPTAFERRLDEPTPLETLTGVDPANPRQADGPVVRAAQVELEVDVEVEVEVDLEVEEDADVQPDPLVARHGFRGERAELYESTVNPSNAEFGDLIEQGSIPTAGGQQTRYFQTDPVSGDGVIVAEFVIQEEVSGYLLAGDGRDLAADNDDPSTHDPLGIDLPLDASRMIVVIDRESGRGVVTVSASENAHAIVPHVEPAWPSGGPGEWPVTVRMEPLRVGARPIVFGDSHGFDAVPANYFNIEASADSIRIDYDAINPITAPTRTISVDGPIVLERSSDGSFEPAPGHSPDLYPAVGVMQYLPDGTRDSIYFEEGTNVFEGATPAPVGEVFEATRETVDELQEGWRETGEASWRRKPWEVFEAGVETTGQIGEGALQTFDDAVLGGELQEGADETRAEWDEMWRETGEDSGLGKVWQVTEGSVEVTGQLLEAGLQTLFGR